MTAPVPCKCGHAQVRHIAGAGLCTGDVTCACDSYVPRLRVISDEAKRLADAVMRPGRDRPYDAERVAEAMQELIDQRVGWEREASKLLAQRDYADRRANDIESRCAAAADALHELARRLEARP